MHFVDNTCIQKLIPRTFCKNTFLTSINCKLKPQNISKRNSSTVWLHVSLLPMIAQCQVLSRPITCLMLRFKISWLGQPKSVKSFISMIKKMVYSYRMVVIYEHMVQIVPNGLTTIWKFLCWFLGPFWHPIQSSFIVEKMSMVHWMEKGMQINIEKILASIRHLSSGPISRSIVHLLAHRLPIHIYTHTGVACAFNRQK